MASPFVSQLKSPFQLNKTVGFAFSVAKVSPPPAANSAVAFYFSPTSPVVPSKISSKPSTEKSNETFTVKEQGKKGTRFTAAFTPSSFLTPGVLPQRRRSDQDGTPSSSGSIDSKAAFGGSNQIRPLRASPLLTESPCFGSSQFSASKACQALIYSPCRSENYRWQRRRLYHQDEYDDVKRKLSLPESGGGGSDHRTPKLGKGGFGSVYIGKYGGKMVAIKQLHASNGESLCAEMNAFRLDHPHIVKILTFSCSGPHMQIVFEYAGRRNLQQLLDDTVHCFRAKQRAIYCQQIADALDYCHSNRILHLDVKPSNVLLTNDLASCKLGDFGCSRLVVSTPKGDDTTSGNASASSTPGTLIYKAPELLRGATATAKADVYSFGYIMWQCATRQEPFEGMNTHTIVFCVVAKDLRPTLKQSQIENLTKEEMMLIELAQRCWKAKPEIRPELEEVRKVLLEYTVIDEANRK